jgi:hypothetical protein
MLSVLQRKLKKTWKYEEQAEINYTQITSLPAQQYNIQEIQERVVLYVWESVG